MAVMTTVMAGSTTFRSTSIYPWRPSGRFELVILAMATVTEAPGRRIDWKRHRPHQLTHLGAAADVMAAEFRPSSKVFGIGVELVRSRIERCLLGPARRRLTRDVVHDRDAEGNPVDRLVAAGASFGVVLGEDGRDPDTHDPTAAKSCGGHAAIVSERPPDRGSGVMQGQACRDHSHQAPAIRCVDWGV